MADHGVPAARVYSDVGLVVGSRDVPVSDESERGVESLVADGDGCGRPLAIAFSSAAMVASSTVPVGLTPSSVWNAFRALVSSGVHAPSTGPSQNPAS